MSCALRNYFTSRDSPSQAHVSSFAPSCTNTKNNLLYLFPVTGRQNSRISATDFRRSSEFSPPGTEPLIAPEELSNAPYVCPAAWPPLGRGKLVTLLVMQFAGRGERLGPHRLMCHKEHHECC